ncbi:MAG: hypothetical protein DMG06_22995 [Acidobacteria bacterium]|nr:MAG: hypothetical protein DMG06_22995 [Acidobacteriota bacterium]
MVANTRTKIYSQEENEVGRSPGFQLTAKVNIFKNGLPSWAPLLINLLHPAEGQLANQKRTNTNTLLRNFLTRHLINRLACQIVCFLYLSRQ